MKRPVAALVLGHGAGGGVGAPDLVASARVAGELGFTVALVEQPYRVAGRRSAAPAAQLDGAWVAVIEHLRTHELAGLPPPELPQPVTIMLVAASAASPVATRFM